MRMFRGFIWVSLDVYAFLSAEMQKEKRLHSRRFRFAFWFLLGCV